MTKHRNQLPKYDFVNNIYLLNELTKLKNY